MKKTVILVFFIISSAFSQTLKNKIDEVLEDKFFESCLVAIQVEDLTADKTLYKKNEKILLRPASNMKVITSGAGLLFLGPDYEFRTELYHDGYVSNDTLFGDLYFTGGCDPDFLTEDLYDFAESVKALNVSFINGNIYGDVSFKDSLFWGKGWMWDDDPSSDAPYLSALNINDNCIEVFIRNEGDSVYTIPRTGYVKFYRVADTSELTIDRKWTERKNDIIIKGQNDGKDYYTKVNVLNPEKYFLTLFSEILDSLSIKLLGVTDICRQVKGSVLLHTSGRKYSEVIKNLNKESDNLSAEMTLYAIAEKFSGRPASAENGIRELKKMIMQIGLNPDDYRFVDGSGVSHYNLVNAELLVGLLEYFYKQRPDLFKILYNSFPVGGVDGTLENRMKNTAAGNNLHAKTGSLSGVSTLSGYITTRKNHILAFSILMQNYVGSSSKAKELQDRICSLLAEYK